MLSFNQHRRCLKNLLLFIFRFGRWAKVNLIVLAKGIKSHFVRTPKLPALPPSSPEVSRPEMNGKDSMADGHPVIGNGSIDTHQNIEDHPKLTITDTVTGLTIILYPSFHSCFSLLWMHCFALTIGYLVVSLVLLAFYHKFLLLLYFLAYPELAYPYNWLCTTVYSKSSSNHTNTTSLRL